MSADACAAADPDALDLRRLPCTVSVCRCGVEREEVVAADGPRCLRMEVVSGSLLEGPVRLHHHLSGFEELEASIMTLRRLSALHRLGRFPPSLFPPERRGRRWAMALQAHDAASAGASHKEIARVLFGPERVETDWRRGGDLRMRVQRLVRTADRFIAGYRDLLRG